MKQKHNSTQCMILKLDNMAFSKITPEGESFIKHVCNTGFPIGKTTNTLLRGKNSYPFPYCKTSAANQIWTCTIKIPTDPTRIISTADELANALIYWFNTYSKEYSLDANVIAAQSYTESSYVVWNYAPLDSTASGISQILMKTLWDVIVNENGKKYDSTNPITPEETYAINNNLEAKELASSYSVGSYNNNNPQPSHDIAWRNRPLLHQNVINNPGIMIKAQCKLMSFFAKGCNNLTSSALFCYNRGFYQKSTYTDTIVACKKGKLSLANPNYPNEGLKYVLKTFGILGDKNNFLETKGLGKNYKPTGKYFGYDENYEKTDPSKNLRLKEPFNINAASNIQSEEQYGNKKA